MYARLTSLVHEILRQEGLPEIELVIRDLPFSGRLGLAISNVFHIARSAYPDADKSALKLEVDKIAATIARHLNSASEFESVEAENGYVNCFINPKHYAHELATRILKDGTNWGRGVSSGGRVMIEYSQPNTHKAFHIGHVRNVALGASLVRCYRYLGRDTVAANYIGDSGAHIFKSLWYLESREKGLANAPTGQKERGVWLGEIYVKAGDLLSESEELKKKFWELLKPLSVSFESFWLNNSLIEALSIDPMIREIALKKIDIFEKRSSHEVAALMRSLYEASIAIYEEAIKRGIIACDNPVKSLFTDLEKMVNDTGFEEIWGRENELLSIAERWHKHDPELFKLWIETRQWSLDDFNRIYSELGAPFDEDAIFYESEVESEGGKIASDLEWQGIVTISEGAKIVDIDDKLHEMLGEPEQNKYRVAVLVRSDGASLYGAKDLALARKKFREYKIEESIYVVGIDQKFYFQQIFQILRLMGFLQWEKCFHLAYELVMLPGGKMSSRKGQVILYDDVAKELEQRALDTVNEKNPSLSEEAKLDTAHDVALGALLYGMQRVDTNKKINFDFDEVLDFDGRSAPYIQYAGARACSIVRKAQADGIEVAETIDSTDFDLELMPVEIDLLGLIGRFPAIVGKVVDDKKPIHLASYAYDLAVKFSDFYHQCPVLIAQPDVRKSRLLMVKMFRITIEAALGILGIASPEVM
jgi:arginyl-tRNA synthetase